MNDRGATLLETAIFLPLGLVLILVLIWGGIFITSSASFDRWMTQAPRLMTRGKESAMGKQMISQVQSWNTSGGAIPADLLPLLTSNVNSSSAEDYLNGATMGVFASSGIKFSDLPPEYIYAFVYLNQGLSEAIGPTVKFPCDPTASPAAATEDAGPGCVGCEFLNPDTYDDTEWDGSSNIPGQKIALLCRYQPSNFILKPIFNLIRLISGGAVEPRLLIERTRVFDWER